MKAVLFLIAAASTATLIQGNQLERQDQAFVCDIPTNGCTNGMFNVVNCECECIEPYCPDWYGDCTNPSGACGGNPWTLCTRGENCPWWSNPLKDEACTTGPNVPLEEWDIYNTREACCNTNFPYSEICAASEEEGPPTKYPTIEAPEDDIYEVVPIKFDVFGLPASISMRELKDEMKTVLTRILLRLTDRIEGLRVSSIEERVVVQRNLIMLRKLQSAGETKDVTLFFNVNIVRDENRKFGPLIINAIRDSYDEVIEQVQTFTDTGLFTGGNVDLNWCTSKNGKYDDCVKDITPPTPVQAPTAPSGGNIQVNSDPPPPEDTGLAGWVIAVIIISVLIIVCCAGYWIAVCCFGVANCCAPNDDRYNEDKEIQNNIYMNDNKSRGGSRYNNDRGVDDRSRATGYNSRRSGRSGRSKRTTHDDESNVQIVLRDPQDPHFDDDSFSINTYSTSKNKNKKQARDPTMYIPGQEDRPDPETDGRSTRSGASSRRYLEDPPLKPKRDPTMYDNGMRYDDASRSREDPPLKPKRDPTMYVEGQEDPSVYVEGQEDPSVYVEGQRDPTMFVDGASASEAYSVGHGSRYSSGANDPYGMGGIDEDESYDQFGFKSSELDAEYMTSETNAEYARGARDPSYYVQEESFRTEEPSVGGKSGGTRPKKKKKSKKSSSSRH